MNTTQLVNELRNARIMVARYSLLLIAAPEPTKEPLRELIKEYQDRILVLEQQIENITRNN